MPYFKREGVVVQADKPPVDLNKDTAFLSAGMTVPITSIAALLGMTDVSVVPCESQEWEEATELEYKVYRSELLGLESLAERDIRANMWALNNASASQLRLGGIYPIDEGNLAGIESIERKAWIISQTQHGYDSSLPSRTKKSNAFWANWVVSMRKKEPFIYIGE